MARRRSTKRPYGAPHPELDVERVRGGFGSRIERGPRGEDYHVAVSRQSEKSYVCPGCGQEVPPGVTHTVAWADGHIFGEDAAVAARRHWHTHCWERFGRQRG